MKWNKKGLIFKTDKQSEIMYSHTSPINAVVLEDRIRIFFSSRAKQDTAGNYVSYPTYIDVDKKNPEKVLYIHKEALMNMGEPGCFDRHGIMLYKSMWFNEKLYMYYGGWQRLEAKEAPYQVLLGLAISENNGNEFKKISQGPVMGMDSYDPISIGNVYPFVKGEDIYLFYTTYTHWEYNGIKATPEYQIKLATSKDGIHWTKENLVVVDADEKGGVATPTVFEYGGKYIMLFGYRKPYENGVQGAYSIGYAESTDLIHWIRKDEEAGLVISETGWDSEMVCYPHVVEVDGKILMFYCGNGYGRDGFGYAVLED